MNWKPITNLDGLPIADHELVLVHYKSGAQETVQVFRVRTGQIPGLATHWAIVEPLKPMTDSQAFEDWRQSSGDISGHRAWHAALAWERTK